LVRLCLETQGSSQCFPRLPKWIWGMKHRNTEGTHREGREMKGGKVKKGKGEREEGKGTRDFFFPLAALGLYMTAQPSNQQLSS